MEPQKTIAPISYFKFYHMSIFLLIALMMINSSSCTAAKLGYETDKLALLDFKSLIANDPFEILSSWNESRHHCQWPGVTCGLKHQRVTCLNLYNQSLLGPISPHIGNLSFLEYIDLSMNRLYGEIPKEIGWLYRLRLLYMTNNTLEESIPVMLSNCTDLMRLSLGGNKLTGEVPASLGSLKKLVVLVLENNYLEGEIPRSFGNLSSLEYFTVQVNNLQGSIPKELCEIRSLSIFLISANNFSGIFPLSLYNISSLKAISVAKNQLIGSLPSNFGSTLPNLNTLYMGANLFTGIIPASTANASRLQIIGVSENHFSGQIPTSLGFLSDLYFLNMELNQLGDNSTQDLNFLVRLSNCTNLSIFSSGYNNLGGQLPNSIANLSVQLNVLVMGGNHIYGSIPESLGSLSSLYNLGMEYNLLSGVIPSSFGTLRQLQKLLLHGNQISGQIPSSMGNMSQLGELYISSNKISGEIPESIGNCQKLKILDISDNNFVGALPPQVILIPSLSISLNLSKNFLTGQLPAEVGKLISLNSLDISGNNLSGEIPPSIGDCLSMEYLNMRGNSFRGTIPSNLAYLKGIKYLDLSSNNLSGKIPKVLENLTYLQYLNLSFNDLEGEIPRKGVFGNASEISLVGNKDICGGVPELNQSSCPVTKVKKTHNISNKIKLVTAIVSGLVFLIAVTTFSIIYWRGKTEKTSNAASFEEDKLMKTSYWDLYKATNGFSSENCIGSGSFGSVYKGNLTQEMEKVIAVKVLNLENSRASNSFIAECKILKNVRHRNLLKILTYCSSLDSRRNEFKALVYEFMPNGNLDMWLHPDKTDSSRTLSLLQRVNIAIDIASALDYLHIQCEVPIVHCDLKPSNILLNDDMSARVGDFGLARFQPKASTEISELSSTGMKGTIGYAAPEYGTASKVSTCGDIYSFGITLLEMMTGRRPTDDIFKDDLNFHKYVEKALPIHVNQIMDPLLYREEQAAMVEEEELDENNDEITEKDHRRNSGSSSDGPCIISILSIGLACSQEIPTQRMDLNDVNKELHRIKRALLGPGRKRL